MIKSTQPYQLDQIDKGYISITQIINGTTTSLNLPLKIIKNLLPEYEKEQIEKSLFSINNTIKYSITIPLLNNKTALQKYEKQQIGKCREIA